MSAVLAVDVGGTTIKGAVVAADGELLVRHTAPTGRGAAALANLHDVLDRLRADARQECLAAGIVTPGIVDSDARRVLYTANVGWRDLALGERLEAALGVPVAVGHDVRAAGAAEALLGPARGTHEFVFVPLGTGIAAALVSGDRPITGVGNAAGEVGHIPVHPGGEACACGQRGCLEVYASGGGIARRYAAATGTPARAEEVLARCATDRIARRVWNEAVEALALGLATLTMTLDPAVIVLGGGLALAGDALFQPVRTALSGLLTWRDAPPVEPAALGPDAGLIGAAVQAFHAAGRPEVPAAWSRHGGTLLAAASSERPDADSPATPRLSDEFRTL